MALDEKVIQELHATAGRLGVSEDEVVEEAVRRFVSLEVLDEVWTRNHLPEDEAAALATAELRAMRAERRVS